MVNELRIVTFGGLSIQAGEKAVTELASRKAELLLVYLAVQKRGYVREVLAELLWADRSQSQSLANLRVVLSSLRKQLGEYVRIERDWVGLQEGAEVWLDAGEFEAALSGIGEPGGAVNTEQVEQVKGAVELYRGAFLEGVYVQEADGLAGWVEQEREHLQGLVVRGLSWLAGWCLQAGEYREGIGYAGRLVELDPLMESGHRQLMKLLALDGQRGAAMSQYERFKLLLAHELGVEPEAETLQLYEQIRDKALKRPEPGAEVDQEVQVVYPAFLRDGTSKAAEGSVFVGREVEIQVLKQAFQAALQGDGQLRLVMGGPGQGKSTLLAEFSRQVAEEHPEVLVGLGVCSAFSGVGDAYLPFREVMGMLCGDVGGRYAEGAVSWEQARRLYESLPAVLRLLEAQGQDLVGVLVQGEALAARAEAAFPGQADLLGRLAELVKRERPVPGEGQQVAVFEEFLRFLCDLSQEHPLLIVLDDLQWADSASINLLFYLGSRLKAGRILMAGAYRPEEVISGESSLYPTLAEVKRRQGDIWIDLSAATESRGYQFVDTYLDMEPNRLGEAFREALYRHTGGHPLFTVELCRSLQERGILGWDREGYWEVQAELEWEQLPVKVEGVIESRLGMLDEKQREILEAAAVEGEEFTLQVVAQVCRQGERQLAHELSDSLHLKYQLVSEAGVHEVGNRSLYRYRFRHSLYREYLLQHLGEFDRRFVHGEVGAALESLYGDYKVEIAPQLGWHYHQAREVAKAIHYLLLAGDQARLGYAYPEAIRHYRTAVELLKEKREYDRASRVLLKLGLTYHTHLEFEHSRQAYAQGFALQQRSFKETVGTQTDPAPHALRIPLPGYFSYDNIFATNMSFSQTRLHLFSGLVSQNPDLDILPDGAFSWEVSDDGCTYVFHLRNNVTWSDGVPVTAQDYVCAWRRVLNPNTSSESASLLYDIKGARVYHQGLGSLEDLGVWAVDRFTLKVELENPASYFLHLLTYPLFFPSPAHMLERIGEDWAKPGWIVTNGPFMIEEWLPKERMVIQRDPSYHGGFSGNVDRVEIISNWFDHENFPDLLYQEYNSNNLDIIGRFSDGDRFQRKLHHPEEYVVVPNYSTTNVLFNSGCKPFDDLRVRQAFAHAIDKQWIVDTHSPSSNPATGGLIPPGIPGHSPGSGLPFDPERARNLLSEAGYPDGKVFPENHVLLLSPPVPPGQAPLFEALCKLWRDVLGVEVRYEFSEDESVTPQRLLCKGQCMGITSLIPDYLEGDWYLRFYVEEYLRKPMGWKNEAYDQLMQASRSKMDQAERLGIYQQADRILMESAVVVPLFTGPFTFLVKPWIKKYLPNTVFVFGSWKDMIIEAHD